MEQQTSTYGQQLVGLNFNPGGSPGVDAVKSAYATIIDRLNDLREKSKNNEQRRLLSIAITQAEGACMFAVKGITWGL